MTCATRNWLGLAIILAAASAAMSASESERQATDQDCRKPTAPETRVPEAVQEKGIDSNVAEPGPAPCVVQSPQVLAETLMGKTSSFKLDLTVNRFDGATYDQGEDIFVYCSAKQEGYLYLVWVAPDGSKGLLYPRCGEDNRIPARKRITIPVTAPQTTWSVPEVPGIVKIWCVVASRPIVFQTPMKCDLGDASLTKAPCRRWIPQPPRARNRDRAAMRRQTAAPRSSAVQDPRDVLTPLKEILPMLRPFAQDETQFRVAPSGELSAGLQPASRNADEDQTIEPCGKQRPPGELP